MVIQRLRPYFSGHGVQVEGLCRELARRGVDATIVTAVHGPQPSLEQLDGYRIRRLRCDLPMVKATTRSMHLWGPAFGLRTLAYLCRRRDLDLVHVHALTDALYTSWLCTRLRGLPLLFEMTLVGEDDPLTVQRSKNLFRTVRYAIFRRCDGYVAISPALALKYEQAGLPPAKLRVVPQGVDLEGFRPVEHRISLRRQLELPLHGPLLIFVGSLIYRKGLDLLLSAWAQVHSRYPDAHLALVGKNQFDGEPEAGRFLAQQLGRLPGAAASNLHLVGARERVSQYLQAADVFLFPSRREGFGTAVVEAMACGLPCIVAELPGITDFIFSGDGSDGIVVPPEDPSVLAAAAARLIAEPDHARAIGRRARGRAVERFSFARIADTYLDYYASLVRARRARLRV